MPPAANAAPMIEVRGLTKTFGPLRAVDDLSFQVHRGEVVGLLGGNGAGKTTTVSMLLGLLTPSSGEIRIMGVDMLRHRHDALQRMNFSSPYVDLPKRLTVRENLTVYGHLYRVPGIARRIADLAEALHITEFIDRPYGKLSAGQQTRVSLAKALLNMPELLLLDEPTASLDPDTGDWVRTYLEGYIAASGAAVLLASHNMGEVERLCGRVMMMRAGRVQDQDTPANLLSRYGRANLEEVFLDIARDRQPARSAQGGTA